MNLRFVLLGLPLILVGIYAGLCLGLYLLQDKLIFPREPGNFEDCPAMAKLGAVPVQTGELRFHEKTSPANKSTLIVFHGNGGTACDRAWILEGLKDLPLNFIFVEYPGYAQINPHSPSPTEKEILAQAESIVDRVETSGSKIILFGGSLGSGVATYAASRRKVSGLILQAPYTSLAAVGQYHYPLFPVRLLSRFPFRAEKWAPLVTAPVLVLRAAMDETIPYRNTEAQIKNFKSPVQVVEFRNAFHNTIETSDPGLYWASIRRFLETLND